MFNLYSNIKTNPGYYRQFSYRDSLISVFNCPLENRFADTWSHYNYIVYVVEGRKIWHTAEGSYDLTKGTCVFIRKGACVIKQFFDVEFCLVLFFLPDDYICEVLKTKSIPLSTSDNKHRPVMPIDVSASVETFFSSMFSYFDSSREPDPSLLELKFRELILTLADDPSNSEITAYFQTLLKQPMSVALQRTMEENYRYNLKLEEFARLCNRSLSAFKRDFQKTFGTTPGKWLADKRLQHAYYLLSNFDKTVSEVAFESGFENISHFSRCFRERYGHSPAAVKQERFKVNS